MLDPAYSKEFEQLRNAADEELVKIRREQFRIAKDFIRDHPSQIELKRRACITQLVESGDWTLHPTYDRIPDYTWCVFIKRFGFPTTILLSKKGMVSTTQIEQELDGFKVYMERTCN